MCSAPQERFSPQLLSEVEHASLQYYPRLRRVKLFVEEHYNEEISLARAAQVAGLEKKYFSAFFRAKVGLGFMDWLTRLRVTKALRLIAREDRVLTQLGFDIGFKEPRTFQRAFKRCTGLTPRDFRKLIRPS